MEDEKEPGPKKLSIMMEAIEKCTEIALTLDSKIKRMGESVDDLSVAALCEKIRIIKIGISFTTGKKTPYRRFERALEQFTERVKNLILKRESLREEKYLAEKEIISELEKKIVELEKREPVKEEEGGKELEVENAKLKAQVDQLTKNVEKLEKENKEMKKEGEETPAVDVSVVEELQQKEEELAKVKKDSEKAIRDVVRRLADVSRIVGFVATDQFRFDEQRRRKVFTEAREKVQPAGRRGTTKWKDKLVDVVDNFEKVLSSAECFHEANSTQVTSQKDSLKSSLNKLRMEHDFLASRKKKLDIEVKELKAKYEAIEKKEKKISKEQKSLQTKCSKLTTENLKYAERVKTIPNLKKKAKKANDELQKVKREHRVKMEEKNRTIENIERKLAESYFNQEVVKTKMQKIMKVVNEMGQDMIDHVVSTAKPKEEKKKKKKKK